MLDDRRLKSSDIGILWYELHTIYDYLLVRISVSSTF